MPKLVLTPKFPYVQVSPHEMQRQIAALKQVNEELRARVVAAQQDKVAAVNQAETLRKEKERLRARVNSLKLELAEQTRINEQLQVKIAELQEALESQSNSD